MALWSSDTVLLFLLRVFPFVCYRGLEMGMVEGKALLLDISLMQVAALVKGSS